MDTILRAILSLRPGARWSFDSSQTGLAGLTWLDEEQQPPTAEEVEAEIARLEGPPSKAQRVATVLATMGKGRDRTTIQIVIEFAELFAAPKLAAEYGVSLEFAIMGLYARNKTYRESKDAELACRAIEEEP
jgi:hypothetical protein